MGGDRELVLFSAAITFILCIAAANWKACLVGTVFWFVTLGVLRVMAKTDPLMRHVWLRNRMYRGYYAARSHPWRRNHNDQSTPFSRQKRVH